MYVVMRQGSVALQRIGGSKVRSSSHNNTVVESLLLVRNSRPTTGSSSTSTSRRVKLLVCFLLLLVGFQWFSENFASLGTVGLRTVVFPLVRPRCLPTICVRSLTTRVFSERTTRLLLSNYCGNVHFNLLEGWSRVPVAGPSWKEPTRVGTFAFTFLDDPTN